LSICDREFTLKLNASGLQYMVTGDMKNLAASLIIKGSDDDHQNICCTLYDGTYFYNFGEQLDSQQQSQLVAAMTNFINGYRF